MPFPVACIAAATQRRKGQKAVITVALSPAADTFVRENLADSHYETATNITVRTGAGIDYSGLLLFDLSGVPAGATIISATLRLTCVTQNANASNINIHRILAANNGWVAACNWNYADGTGASQRWAGDAGGDGGADAGCSVVGTDYNAAAIGTFTMASNDPVGTVYTVTLDTTQFAALVANNYGLIMFGSSSTLKSLGSQENATPAYRPVLTVVYQG